MTDYNPTADYHQWLEIDYFYRIFYDLLGSKVSKANIKTLANMHALTYAMKMRDYHAGLIKEPENIQTIAQTFAKNLIKALGQNESASEDWMELFILGHNRDKEQEKELHNKKDQGHEFDQQFSEDEYARLALIEYGRNNDLSFEKTKQLVMRLLKLQQKNFIHQKHHVKQLQKLGWFDMLFNFFKGGRLNFLAMLGLRVPLLRKRLFFPIVSLGRLVRKILTPKSVGQSIIASKSSSSAAAATADDEMKLSNNAAREQQLQEQRFITASKEHALQREIELLQEKLAHAKTSNVEKIRSEQDKLENLQLEQLKLQKQLHTKEQEEVSQQKVTEEQVKKETGYRVPSRNEISAISPNLKLNLDLGVEGVLAMLTLLKSAGVVDGKDIGRLPRQTTPGAERNLEPAIGDLSPTQHRGASR